MNALIAHFGQQQGAGLILVLARLTPLFLFSPLFSSTLFPARARGVAAVAIALGLAPMALHGQHIPMDVLSFGGLILKEMLVGAAFSFAVGALFAAVSVAGSFLDLMIGFSFGSLVDPASGTQTTILSQLYAMLAVLIFIAIGGDQWMIEGLARTYQLVPLDSGPALGSLIGGTEHAFVSIFVSALEVAAPVMIAVVIADVGFGVVARVMPQLNVFAIGFPAKIIIGFLIIGASLPFAAGWIDGQLQSSIRSALDTLHVG